MPSNKKELKIKIVKDGPYIVSGGIPLSEKIIVPVGKGYEYRDGKSFELQQEYSLCRCGRSKNMPFCDGSHLNNDFKGTETASRAEFNDRAELQEGPELDLLDDHRCAYARFCHRNDGNVWDLVDKSDNPELRKEAIAAASECPAGRLVARDKDGNPIEPNFEPAIEVLQDPEENSSGPLFVKGNIPLESEDGTLYEVRNRMTLCRCGNSKRKPFCDATHVIMKFSDENSK